MRLVDRLRTALARPLTVELIAHDGVRAHHDGLLTPAAVLIAVTDRARPGVLFTQRPDTMRKHPGQVAFPGGRVDPDDRDAVAAALREAHEEIALPPGAVEIVGTADPYRTITSYAITTVMGVVPPDLPLVANPDEVSAIFETPLDVLLDPGNHQMVSINWEGDPRHYYEIYWENRRIWGATAAMIVNLSRRMGQDW